MKKYLILATAVELTVGYNILMPKASAANIPTNLVTSVDTISANSAANSSPIQNAGDFYDDVVRP